MKAVRLPTPLAPLPRREGGTDDLAPRPPVKSASPPGPLSLRERGGTATAHCKALMLVGLWLVLGAGAWGDSLYGTGTFFGSLFSDRKATKVGDVLQVIIEENASATHSAERSNQMTTQSSIGPGGGKLGFLPLWSYGGSSQSSAQAGASRTESFAGRVSVTVKGTTPAGNLLIEGERAVQVNRDLQKIKLTGEVRPQDVLRDNTVLSSAVANAHIEYEGSDPGKPGSKVGIVTGLLHWLF